MKFPLKSACHFQFHALTIQAHSHTPLPKHILYFLAACGISKENLSIAGVTQKNIELNPPPHSLYKSQELKDEILSPPRAPILE